MAQFISQSFQVVRTQWLIQINIFSSYLKRFWKKPLFDLLDQLRTTLDRIYGEGKVTLIDASLRWMYHHSKMDGACGGTISVFSDFLVPW